MPEQIQSIIANFKSFGVRRLALMGGIAALVMAVIGIASVYLNRPAYETLYVGLERSDVNQIGLVLGDAGIGFDVGSDGTSVLVPAGTTAQARMLLAEKGLPTSANAGYELFDNVGSLGLTSFMQEVTKVRALEGEIARTIQSIAGIKAARERIVAGSDEDRADFLRKRGFSKADTTKIIGTVLAEEGHPPSSVFDFVQGITAVARDKAHQDARLDMEARAKKLFDRVT